MCKNENNFAVYSYKSELYNIYIISSFIGFLNFKIVLSWYTQLVPNSLLTQEH